MKRNNLKVAYLYEHGNKSLPPLRKLVSEKPNPEKSRIIDYLKTHCVYLSRYHTWITEHRSFRLMGAFSAIISYIALSRSGVPKRIFGIFEKTIP